MKTDYFEGWYFKHQLAGDMIAFIPGKTADEAFIQMIYPNCSRQFKVRNLSVCGGIIYADECRFSKSGCKISLPGVSGKISYGELTPLKYDIMGPFCHFNMECRHGIISMSHTLDGSISVDGCEHNFSGGTGYIEKDSGISFPSSYQWLQCSDFSNNCSIMVSIARIPFLGAKFTGCICAIVYNRREYRLATYKGVRILASDIGHICLSQGKLLLEIDINSRCGAHALRSPVQGKMSGTIGECCNAGIRARLWEHKKPVFDMESLNAAYEYVQSPLENKLPDS